MIGVYIRVSSAGQVKDGYSLTAQKERLTAFCQAQGWDNYKFYVEEGLSAKNTKRPVYQELMQHVERKKVNTVLVYKLDRIMRSIGELDNMLKTFDNFGCAFKSATEPFDTTNATGKLFIYLVGALAQWEIELSSERIKMVLEEKVANEGVWIGNVPYPFDKDDKTKKLVANKERSKDTLKMIDLLKKGYSSTRIADYMNNNAAQKKRWHPNTVLRILRNPALYGATRWNDDVYKNTHNGIITESEFDHVQDVLKERELVHQRDVKSIYIFQGKIACPSCGKIMNVNRYLRPRKDGTITKGATYKCPPCANAKKFNNSPSELRILNRLYDYMKEVKMDDISKVKVEHKEPSEIKEFENVKNKRNKYQKAWANDLITDEEFQKLMEDTRELYERLKEKVDNLEIPKPVDVNAIKNVVIMFNRNFKKLSYEEKREFIAMFVKEVHFKMVTRPPKDPRSTSYVYDLEITNVVFY